MKNQLNMLNQLQELVLTRDEHHQTGNGSRMEALDDSIDQLSGKLDAAVREMYTRLYKKSHIVVSPMIDGCCAVCGMRLPTSQVQQVRMAKTLQTCSSCGRILFNEEEDAPRRVGEKAVRGEPRKSGISRFSAEELCIADLKSKTPAGAIEELANRMVAHKFVTNAPQLVKLAMEREGMCPTSIGESIAFPHVRGVEGGGLTLALGVSKDGIVWDGDGSKVNIVCFSVIPVAVSPFYLRLMSALTDAFRRPDTIKLLTDAPDGPQLWKAFMKATRYSVR